MPNERTKSQNAHEGWQNKEKKDKENRRKNKERERELTSILRMERKKTRETEAGTKYTECLSSELFSWALCKLLWEPGNQRIKGKIKPPELWLLKELKRPCMQQKRLGEKWKIHYYSAVWPMY